MHIVDIQYLDLFAVEWVNFILQLRRIRVQTSMSKHFPNETDFNIKKQQFLLLLYSDKISNSYQLISIVDWSPFTEYYFWDRPEVKA